MKSLKAAEHRLSQPELQLEILNNGSETLKNVPKFGDKLRDTGLHPLKPTGIDIFQVNVGYMCNETCKHCHVDAGPDRKEIMTRETMELCLDAVRDTDIGTVDLTGGAPEMNPHFRWFVEEIKALNKHIIVRSNLTILTVNPKYRELPLFFAEHGVEVVASLPYYLQRNTDAQRGDGVFDKSIIGLQMLNAVGYAQSESDLMLNLAYNPTGAFLPANQKTMEADFRRVLKKNHDISFNNLFAITNLPISRFLDFLIMSGNVDDYMTKLVNAYNPSAAANVMCRNIISVGWDGYLYDCDFNQMLQMKVNSSAPRHLRDFDLARLNERTIVIDQHCYGCTAGAGSSCGGAIA
ncbi:MAG: radical SAM/Cys-rich domain protein [Balneolaceae bacterium]|nr:MAG: radical SAM/Cys-rich domain protein [Balneolaceae bacterium]